MIDLDQQSSEGVFSESSNLQDVYRMFTGYYGRTLKVSSSSARTEYGYLTEEVKKRNPRDLMRSVEEVVATLTEIQLVARGNSGFGGSSPRRIPGAVKLGLRNREPLDVLSSGNRIEVFQEDIGQWKLLFQGSAWSDYSDAGIYRGGRL